MYTHDDLQIHEDREGPRVYNLSLYIHEVVFVPVCIAPCHYKYYRWRIPCPGYICTGPCEADRGVFVSTSDSVRLTHKGRPR